MSEIMKQSPEAKTTKLSVSKQACHQIAGLATSILLATWLAWCKPQDANAQTAPPVVEAEMPEAEIKQYAENTSEPKIMDASFSTPEVPQELDIPTQIKNLEKQIAELGNWDIRERIALRKQLIALEKAETAAEKAETDEATKRENEAIAMNDIARKLAGEK